MGIAVSNPKHPFQLTDVVADLYQEFCACRCRRCALVRLPAIEKIRVWIIRAFDADQFSSSPSMLDPKLLPRAMVVIDPIIEEMTEVAKGPQLIYSAPGIDS